MKNVDTPDFFALVTDAEITEISCTDLPVNPRAVVQHRYKTPPFAEYLNTVGKPNALLVRGVELLQQQIKALQKPRSRCHQRRRQTSERAVSAASRGRSTSH